jgi:hypothetical protein
VKEKVGEQTRKTIDDKIEKHCPSVALKDSSRLWMY